MVLQSEFNVGEFSIESAFTRSKRRSRFIKSVQRSPAPIRDSRISNYDLLRPMELLWWSVAVILFAVGLIGTVLPVFPGTIIILAGALLHRMMLGPEKSVGWGTITVLVLFTLASYALDFLSGYFGARYFGATKWGMFGALLGALIGVFFGIAGLFVGPVIGAVAGEFIAGKRMIDAGRAGWGSLLGNLGAMIGKLFIALVMITIFFMTVPAPF